MIFPIHHIGIATTDIQTSIHQFSKLGYSSSDIYVDDTQRVIICFLKKDNEVLIELVSPNSEDSPINNILKKNGTSSYHLCYLTDNIEYAVEHFKGLNFKIVVKPVSAIAFNNKKVCFMYNQFTGLIELLEN